MTITDVGVDSSPRYQFGRGDFGHIVVECRANVELEVGFKLNSVVMTLQEYHVLLVNDICIYPESPAQTSGLLAGLILLLVQILVICTCGCSCRWDNKKQPEGWNATVVGVGCILGW